MLRLLHQISVRQLRSSLGRTSLVIGGVATGVSLMVAINIVNASVLQSFRRTISLIAGPAALEVTLGLGEIGFPESALDIVRRDPDVVAAVPLVRGTISLTGGSEETLQLFGADLTAEEELGRYPIMTSDRESIVRGLEDPRTILVTTTFAARHGLQPGRSIRLATPGGVDDFVVRGLLQESGIARILGGQLAVMDLPAAQLLLGKTGRIDQIDIVLRDEVSIAGVQRRLQAALPTALTVSRPEQRGEHYERVLAAFQGMLTGLSTLCLIAGVFIIYNTSATGALRRAAVMAELRLLGAEEGRLFRLLMIEAGVLGTFGTLLGIASGMVLARLLSGMVSDSMGVIFQLRFPVERLTTRLPEQVAIASLGIATTLFASYFAARRASRVEPLDVMRGADRTETRPPRSGRLTACWAVLVAVSAAALAMEVRHKSFAWGNFDSTLWNASVLVIAIPLVVAGGTTLSRVIPRLFGVEGRVAVESILRARSRTGTTVAAVALVIAIGITVSTLAYSFRRSVAAYYEQGFNLGDLVVSAMTTEGGWLETPLPLVIAERLREVPGVKGVEVLRYVTGHVYAGERIALFALSDGFFDPARFGARWYLEGDAREAAEAIRAERGVNISVALADRFNLHVGDSIELETPTGRLKVPIVGVVRDYSSDRGAVMLSYQLLAERWAEPTVSRVTLMLEPGASVEVVRARIAETLGTEYRLKILSFGEMVRYQSAAIDRAFAFTDAMQLLIAIVTVAGIFDLLVAAIVERKRELSLWQVIGADQGSVRRSVVIESATIGALGTALGVVVGLITAWIWVRFNFPYLLGFTLDFHFAVASTLYYAALAMVMTVVAGYGAAYYATRQSVLENLHADSGRTV
ncbi:MAG TPA: ABC transporter permease [Candidatus Binatus sp.]|nr:ABC transporter permease [Candidatus Binatus sp.]